MASRLKPTQRASLRTAVEWIAVNDEPSFRSMEDVEELSGLISVVLVADLWGLDAGDVAVEVIRYRQAEDRGRTS